MRSIVRTLLLFLTLASSLAPHVYSQDMTARDEGAVVGRFRELDCIGSFYTCAVSNGRLSLTTDSLIYKFHTTAPTGGNNWWFYTDDFSTDGVASDQITNLSSTITVGAGGVATVGTRIASGSALVVEGSGDADNEYAYNIGITRVDIGTGYTQTTGPVGGVWGADLNVHGPIGVQPKSLQNVVSSIQNYYNGSPAEGKSSGLWVVTFPGTGGGKDATHGSATTYPVDVGLGISGESSSSGLGFTTGIQVGGTGSPWVETSSKIGTGIHIRDYTTHGIKIDNPSGSPTADIETAGKVIVGTQLTVGGQDITALGFPSQGRLTLKTGDPFGSDPTGTLTPSATDTTAETVDFAAPHGWASGTLVVPFSTVGGLTAGTGYYINATDSDTISIHLTASAALAGTSKVNLTANITQSLTAVGFAHNAIYWSPHFGNRLTLYDGTRWKLYSASELSLSLSSLTSGKNYDVFIYDNSGTPTLELSAAWSNDTTRTDALTTQDGIKVKSGATTRRWVGTIRTVGTAEVESSYFRRFVSNAYHRLAAPLLATDYTTNWTYIGTTWRQVNAVAANKVEVVVGDNGSEINLVATLVGRHSQAGNTLGTAIGEDSTTTPDYLAVGNQIQQQVAATGVQLVMSELKKRVPLGYHAYNWLEYTGSSTMTVFGVDNTAALSRKPGLAGVIYQ